MIEGYTAPYCERIGRKQMVFLRCTKQGRRIMDESKTPSHLTSIKMSDNPYEKATCFQTKNQMHFFHSKLGDRHSSSELRGEEKPLLAFAGYQIQIPRSFILIVTSTELCRPSEFSSCSSKLLGELRPKRIIFLELQSNSKQILSKH
jgi:hypothetical protein